MRRRGTLFRSSVGASFISRRTDGLLRLKRHYKRALKNPLCLNICLLGLVLLGRIHVDHGLKRGHVHVGPTVCTSNDT